MDENTTLKLMSHLVRQVISHYDPQGGIKAEQREEFAERVAEAAWEGLVVMMRQSFAEGEGVTLEHVGRFVKRGGHWLFMPAATLAEADAASAPAEHGHEQLARQALFYLNEGAEILDRLPEDIALPDPAYRARPLEELLAAGAGAEESLTRLSDDVRRTAMRLRKIADRLAGATQSATLPDVVFHTPEGSIVHGEVKESFAGRRGVYRRGPQREFLTPEDWSGRSYEDVIQDALEIARANEERRRLGLSGQTGGQEPTLGTNER